MFYKELEVYGGDLGACSYCNRRIELGETICVEDDKGLIFCYNSEELAEPCHVLYTLDYRVATLVHLMKFGKVQSKIKIQNDEDVDWPDLIG